MKCLIFLLYLVPACNFDAKELNNIDDVPLEWKICCETLTYIIMPKSTCKITNSKLHLKLSTFNKTLVPIIRFKFSGTENILTWIGCSPSLLIKVLVFLPKTVHLMWMKDFRWWEKKATFRWRLDVECEMEKSIN